MGDGHVRDPGKIAAGQTYVASYTAPRGRYAGDHYALSPARPAVNGALTATPGVYTYGSGMPSQTWRDSNYYVDVVYSPIRTSTTPPPTTTPTGSAPAPTPSTACTRRAWTSSEPHAEWLTDGYRVKNNMWNTAAAGPQTMHACTWNGWYVMSNQSGTGTDDGVKTYPSTQRLFDHVPVSSLTTIPSSFDVTVPSGGGTVTPRSKQWNAAYDLWLDDWSTEVMVWNSWTMHWQYWYGVYGGEQVTIDGVVYHAYTSGRAMWFVRDKVTDKGSVRPRQRPPVGGEPWMAPAHCKAAGDRVRLRGRLHRRADEVQPEPLHVDSEVIRTPASRSSGTTPRRCAPRRAW